MKRTFLFILILLFSIHPSVHAQKAYTTAIEPYPNLVKADTGLILQTGYLVVPEDRHRPDGRKIKLSFFFVRRPDQDAQKNITLFMTGGPGYSTTANIDSFSYHSDFLRYGGFIALDQRGAKRTQPCLECTEIDEAIKQSYRQGINKDSLVLIAVRKCRERFQKQGINLSAYNTLETAEDINDLRLALRIDSMNLVGLSYSGGLMLTMAKLHPEGVRSLILNSPLPGFVSYEEHDLLNINEALEQVFINCSTDSADKTSYANLKTRFQQYFISITGRKFIFHYKEKGSKDSLKLFYSKQELLEAIVNRLNTGQVRFVPFVINDIINGNHLPYVKETLDGYFEGNNALSIGMRYSVYCSEQIQYSNPQLEKLQATVLPWMAGYSANDVNHKICDCWKVQPEPPSVKAPLYSTIPTLISAGDIDPWCRPFYNRLIKRYMPNSQVLIVHNRGHVSGFVVDGVNYLDMFMSNPLSRLTAQSKNVIVE